MKLLEDRIRKDGKIFDGDVLKVDSFVNHQIDVGFISELGKEFKRLYEGENINKILTIEASGIALAAMMVSVLTWFASYNRVMTSDKFLYLFFIRFLGVTILRGRFLKTPVI